MALGRSTHTCLQPPGTHRYGHDIRTRYRLFARLEGPEKAWLLVVLLRWASQTWTHKHVQRAFRGRIRRLSRAVGRRDAPESARDVDDRALVAALYEREERLRDVHGPERVRAEDARGCVHVEFGGGVLDELGGWMGVRAR